jgi:hypothetical protein
MFTGQRWRGYVTRTRREPERNVPPGIPEFSPVRFSSGSPPLPGSWMVQSSPLLSPLSVVPKLASCRAYQLHREREEESVQVRVDRSRTLASTGGTLKSTEDDGIRESENTDLEISRNECHRYLWLRHKIWEFAVVKIHILVFGVMKPRNLKIKKLHIEL